jgi:hypothetical protein
MRSLLCTTNILACFWLLHFMSSGAYEDTHMSGSPSTTRSTAYHRCVLHASLKKQLAAVTPVATLRLHEAVTLQLVLSLEQEALLKSLHLPHRHGLGNMHTPTAQLRGDFVNTTLLTV